MVNRLFVDEIMSVGLVDKGDNPESNVLIHKSRNIETGAEWTALMNQRLADQNKTLDRLAKRIENLRPSRMNERRGQEMEKMSFESVGELVTAAIDARARAWHLDGVHVDVPLVKLRTRIRETMPALKALERSQESVAVAKSRVLRAGDRELSAAWDFVAEWS